MSHRSWAPAGVPGGITAFAGPVEAAVADRTGAAALGELHAAATSTTATISATRNGHAERPGLLLLRLYSPDIHFLLHQQVPSPAAIGPQPLIPADPARLIPVAGPVRQAGHAFHDR
jgi:hypothetical protein